MSQTTMKQPPQTLIFLLLFFFQIVDSSITSTADSNIYVRCSPFHFTPQSPYETDVNCLFTTLIDSSTLTSFNKFKGVVNGLYQCRGDIDPTGTKCHDCVASSVHQLKATCPSSVGGAIQLDDCFLKYDYKPFFGVKNTEQMWKRCGPLVGYSSNVLNGRDEALVNLVVASNGNYFHSGDYGILRGMTQCVQDTNLTDCQDCLIEASRLLRSQCETSSECGDMFLGSCYIRYVVDPDIGHSSNDYTSKDHAAGKRVGEIVGIIASILVGLVATTAGVIFRAQIRQFVIHNSFNCCNCCNGSGRPAPMNSDEG